MGPAAALRPFPKHKYTQQVVEWREESRRVEFIRYRIEQEVRLGERWRMDWVDLERVLVEEVANLRVEHDRMIELLGRLLWWVKLVFGITLSCLLILVLYLFEGVFSMGVVLILGGENVAPWFSSP